MYCGNTTFIYSSEFSKYMKVQVDVSRYVFNYLFNIRSRKFFLEKGIYMVYLKKGSYCTLDLMKILTII